MLYEFTIHTTELTITSPFGDGTHALRVVQAGSQPGSQPLEFTCRLTPHLVARVEINDSADGFQIFTQAGREVVKKRGLLELELEVEGKILPDAAGNDRLVRVLERYDCGQQL